ncbi:uncharacterized protein IWZ02DRAFT_260897 [Phyllosticta citriasiana]|uniref:uncharacterized protein n=1 Tax=Phyllosticta citriasiana TaxID=595635 RepID=UPI0030FD7A05
MTEACPFAGPRAMALGCRGEPVTEASLHLQLFYRRDPSIASTTLTTVVRLSTLLQSLSTGLPSVRDQWKASIASAPLGSRPPFQPFRTWPALTACQPIPVRPGNAALRLSQDNRRSARGPPPLPSIPSSRAPPAPPPPRRRRRRRRPPLPPTYLRPSIHPIPSASVALDLAQSCISKYVHAIGGASPSRPCRALRQIMRSLAWAVVGFLLAC